MIYFLDKHPVKAANYYAVDHLRPALVEACQILCDTSRVLIEECRINAIEKKMRDARAQVKPDTYFASLEANVPRPARDLDHAIVRWAAEGQDAWDWMLAYARALIQEINDWTGRGCSDDLRFAVNVLEVDSPRPVHAGRVNPRWTTPPLPVDMEVPAVLDSDFYVRMYRQKYWLKYRNTVQYAAMRRPWWWNIHERIGPTLASRGQDR